ncbi:class I SAM-dependent methyltransferase [Viridibacillus sp. FSL R5-0477]|uniref:SAM-dependent methyltransferase n=1 Tax=Viridibacillus arenosi FSL R5-213 TaxID=1227360 RepID=W4F4R3_9BACL|nr:MULTISPECIES: class I SAM-dependent methyltransferase [Viridibacillus]ETT87775.1 SAM-dependent methyltransferase [Viridibacillus arenosi FSL R5-213]OMC81775.1 SAM-dependent methyltransferase [Viridibacillus sp. FSL H8-0123]OMC89793.1 SAM-dependent methyltransferase [Viridibacillus arenosi]
MEERIIEEIIDCMAIYGDDSTIQKIQTAHRLKLAQFWSIKKGMSVLEIGCGQGDTTAVLAHLVGEGGFVHGIDVADADYGSPITLGEAACHLKASKLGAQIQIDLATDVIADEIDFSEKSFDVVVLSHCSWYFQSAEQLAVVLKKARKWGKTLCFAEWDARVTSIEQYPHFLAVLIQAQFETFKETSISNIRSLFTAEDIKKIIQQAGWEIQKENIIYSPELQDGEWEVDFTIQDYAKELLAVEYIPKKLVLLLQTEILILKDAIQRNAIKPMSTYVLISN